MKAICRKCLEFNTKDEEFEAIIDSYIGALEMEQRASEQLYKERLMKCEECDGLINGLCKYCGCFVLARAAKRHQACPYPRNHKW